MIANALLTAIAPIFKNKITHTPRARMLSEASAVTIAPGSAKQQSQAIKAQQKIRAHELRYALKLLCRVRRIRHQPLLSRRSKERKQISAARKYGEVRCSYSRPQPTTEAE